MTRAEIAVFAVRTIVDLSATGESCEKSHKLIVSASKLRRTSDQLIQFVTAAYWQGW